MSVGTFVKSKSILLVNIPHLAFSLPNAHSIGFLADLSMLLKMTCAFVAQLSCSFWQLGVTG